MRNPEGRVPVKMAAKGADSGLRITHYELRPQGGVRTRE